MDLFVGTAAEFDDPGRKILDIEGTEVAVFQLGGAFYAFENTCPHAGGPACQGKILPRTIETVDDEKNCVGRFFSKDRFNVVCPWHGMEFDIRTGETPISRNYRLRQVGVRVEKGNVFIALPPSRRPTDKASDTAG